MRSPDPLPDRGFWSRLRQLQANVDAVPSRSCHRVDDAHDLEAIATRGDWISPLDERPAEPAERIAVRLAGRGVWRPRLAIGSEDLELTAGRGPRQAGAGD